MSRPIPRVFLLFTLLALLTACDQQVPADDSAVRQAEIASVEATIELPETSPTATFPAQQRALAEAEVIVQGEGVYGINCRSCHGSDLRGGDLGGPNLLRSEVVLKDTNGELIGEVVLNGRNNPGQNAMPPIPLQQADIEAVAAYIHSVVASGQRQGAPPPGEEIELDIVVGDAQAGQEYFAEECSSCHSASGDLAAIATRIPTAESLQDSWVAGSRRGAPADPDTDPTRSDIKVTVTLSDGEVISGTLGRYDDFYLGLTTAAGQHRSFSLNTNTSPAVQNVEINDPLSRHRELLSELTDEVMHNVTAYLVTLK